MKIIVINGPNLNLQGIRETQKYGTDTFVGLMGELRKEFPGIDLLYFQSNVEGEIINCLHERGFNCDGIILNAGAYTHTSIGIGDAVAAIKTPVVEVHISNLASREDFRQRSYIAPHAIGVIFGFGIKGYKLAVQSFLN
ncbi:MAG: 3-dehydroquinate dehydratase [Bacteroidia bacterium]|jgi:3-dehydroquinate dehydratase-2|nr:3-dehydroquinate dehydratase [Bacteroidia bacterium]